MSIAGIEDNGQQSLLPILSTNNIFNRVSLAYYKNYKHSTKMRRYSVRVNVLLNQKRTSNVHCINFSAVWQFGREPTPHLHKSESKIFNEQKKTGTNLTDHSFKRDSFTTFSQIAWVKGMIDFSYPNWLINLSWLEKYYHTNPKHFPIRNIPTLYKRTVNKPATMPTNTLEPIWTENKIIKLEKLETYILPRIFRES